MNKELAEVVKEAFTKIDFLYEANRTSTFKTWVFDDRSKCNAFAMAEAGFIYTGNNDEPDSVKCFLCNKSLDCWDEGDDPWAEHLKHAPYCTFAKKQKPEQELTLSEFLDIRNEYLIAVMKKTLDCKEGHMDNVIDKIIDNLIDSLDQRAK